MDGYNGDYDTAMRLYIILIAFVSICLHSSLHDIDYSLVDGAVRMR